MEWGTDGVVFEANGVAGTFDKLSADLIDQFLRVLPRSRDLTPSSASRIIFKSKFSRKEPGRGYYTKDLHGYNFDL